MWELISADKTRVEAWELAGGKDGEPVEMAVSVLLCVEGPTDSDCRLTNITASYPRAATALVTGRVFRG